MKPAPTIELTIDALVLHGLPNRPGLVAALSAELTRLLAEEGALAGLLESPQSAPYVIEKLAGSLTRASAALHGPGLGAQLGKAIFQSLQGIGAQQPGAGAVSRHPKEGLK